MLLLAILLPASTAPASTAPAGSPVPVEMLDGGRVRYTPPPRPWTLDEKAADSMKAVYRTDDGIGTMTITVTPQSDAVGPEQSKKMALTIGKGIREYARRSGVELLYGPRVENDDRFFLTVHDRLRARGRTYDRLQIYRMLDSLLVSVAVTAQTDSEDEAKTIHAAAQELLDQARTGRGPSLSGFRRTGVRLFPPAEWIEKKIDDPNGIVATYAEPNRDGARMEVRSRVIPKKIRGDDGASIAQRQQIIDEMLAATGIPPADAERITDEENRFARAARLLPAPGRPTHAEARFVMLGDTMIGIIVRGSADRSEELSSIADGMAERMQRIPGR
jgi:hypothetical protein